LADGGLLATKISADKLIFYIFRCRNLKNFNTKGPLTLSAKKYSELSPLKRGEGRVRDGVSWAKPLRHFSERNKPCLYPFHTPSLAKLE